MLCGLQMSNVMQITAVCSADYSCVLCCMDYGCVQCCVDTNCMKADCWICYDPERQDAGSFIQPCSCKGDVATVHHECLKKWLMEVSMFFCLSVESFSLVVIYILSYLCVCISLTCILKC